MVSPTIRDGCGHSTVLFSVQVIKKRLNFKHLSNILEYRFMFKWLQNVTIVVVRGRWCSVCCSQLISPAQQLTLAIITDRYRYNLQL